MRVERARVERIADPAAEEDSVDVAGLEARVGERALDGLRGDRPGAPSGCLRMVGLPDAGDRDRAREIGNLRGAAPVPRGGPHAAPDLALTIHAA